MNKTVRSILPLTTFSLLLIVITLLCGGPGFGRPIGIPDDAMKYSFSGILIAIDLLIIRKVCKLYFPRPKAILSLLGVACRSVLLWLIFACSDQYLWDRQMTNHLLEATGPDGFARDERGLNRSAVPCGIIYPTMGAGCLFAGMRFLNHLLK